jgi:SM-20-related protein
MTLANYDAFDAMPVSGDPFTHIVVENFIPPAALAEVVRGLPKLDRGGSFPIGSLRFGDRAQALMTELEGPVRAAGAGSPRAAPRPPSRG